MLKSFPGVGNDICEPGQDELCYDKLSVRAVPHMLKFVARVRGLLPSLRTPLLVMHSRNDHTVVPESSQVIYDEAGSIVFANAVAAGNVIRAITAPGAMPR